MAFLANLTSFWCVKVVLKSFTPIWDTFEDIISSFGIVLAYIRGLAMPLKNYDLYKYWLRYFKFLQVFSCFEHSVRLFCSSGHYQEV